MLDLDDGTISSTSPSRNSSNAQRRKRDEKLHVSRGPMSQMGQNRKSGDANATSDLPLKADIKRTSREVRKVLLRKSRPHSFTSLARVSRVAKASTDINR